MESGWINETLLSSSQCSYCRVVYSISSHWNLNFSSSILMFYGLQCLYPLDLLHDIFGFFQLKAPRSLPFNSSSHWNDSNLSSYQTFRKTLTLTDFWATACMTCDWTCLSSPIDKVSCVFRCFSLALHKFDP